MIIYHCVVKAKIKGHLSDLSVKQLNCFIILFAYCCRKWKKKRRKIICYRHRKKTLIQKRRYLDMAIPRKIGTEVPMLFLVTRYNYLAIRRLLPIGIVNRLRLLFCFYGRVPPTLTASALPSCPLIYLLPCRFYFRPFIKNLCNTIQ